MQVVGEELKGLFTVLKEEVVAFENFIRLLIFCLLKFLAAASRLGIEESLYHVRNLD